MSDKKPVTNAVAEDHAKEEHGDSQTRRRSRRPRRRVGLLGVVIRSICHIVILTMFFWCLKLALSAEEMDATFQVSPTVAGIFSILGEWSRYWVLSVALATFTLLTWPFHGLLIKLMGAAPLIIGIGRQVV